MKKAQNKLSKLIVIEFGAFCALLFAVIGSVERPVTLETSTNLNSESEINSTNVETSTGFKNTIEIDQSNSLDELIENNTDAQFKIADNSIVDEDSNLTQTGAVTDNITNDAVCEVNLTDFVGDLDTIEKVEAFLNSKYENIEIIEIKQSSFEGSLVWEVRYGHFESEIFVIITQNGTELNSDCNISVI